MAATPRNSTRRARTIALVALIAVAWLVLDQATKAFVEGAYAVGDHIAGPYLGLVQFVLVHNTGMAWGLLGDSTFLLGVLSVLVVAVLAVYLAWEGDRANRLEAIGGALVIGGGLGNAIDRFTLGYVVDFIDAAFIDFPVFNVADIGVTCGFMLFIIGFFLHERALEQENASRVAADEGVGAEPIAAEGQPGPLDDAAPSGDGPEGTVADR